MAGSENDPPLSATATEPAPAEQLVDLTAATGAAVAAEVPPELLAQSLGQYLRAWVQRIRGGDSGVLPVVLGIVVVAVAFQIADGKFLSPQNLVNLFEQSTIYMLLAIAEIFALLLGEIDLSVGLVMGLGAVVVAEEVQPAGLNWPWWLAIIVALLICSAVGAIQGTLVARLRMPSFIVTLGGLLILEGVSIIVLGGSLVGIGNSHFNNEVFVYNLFWGRFDPAVSWILLIVVGVVAATWEWLRDARRRRSGLVAPPASLTALKIVVVAAAGILVVAVCNVNRARYGTIEGLPYIIPIVLVVLATWTVLLQRTRFGRYVYAIGGNPEAARRAGVSLPTIRTWCFVFGALTAGIAGVLFASWQVSITTNIIKDANSYVLLAVAAAVIGGTSLFGGRGRTIHGVLGGLVIGAIYNGLYLIGVTSEWIDVVVALVLLAAGTIDVLSRRGAQPRA
jgi:D-xylose transport system permease protein